jgi:hypothetical protein
MLSATILALLLRALFCAHANAQTYCSAPAPAPADSASCLGDVTLLGAHLQLGVHACASFGAAQGPAGSIKPGARLGLLADFDANGFDVHSYCDAGEEWYYGGGDICPGYSGDFITPGTPIEGTLHLHITVL